MTPPFHDGALHQLITSGDLDFLSEDRVRTLDSGLATVRREFAALLRLRRARP
ncbi:MAG: hypothetical protein WD801_08285 [Gemmatimonadaceae bacterium]